MPTPREVVVDAFAQFGRTVPGLRQVMAVALPVYQQQHDDAAAKAVESGKPVSPEKPGGSKYDPAQTAIKACLSEAFPSASRVGRVPLTVELGEEAAVFCLLSGLGPDTTVEQMAACMQGNLKELCRGAREIGSHSSRYANTRTSLSVIDANTETSRLPYLSSQTVASPVRLGFAGNSANAPALRPLFASFLYDGRLFSLFTQLRVNNREFLERIAVPADVIDALQAILSEPVQLMDRVPQLTWPLGDGSYHALSPLPSVAVLDEIADKHSRDALQESLPGAYLATATLNIGGANPQNAGAFNSATGGAYPLFLSKLFTTGGSQEATFGRRLWSRNWLNTVPKRVADKFKFDFSVATSASIDTFLQSQAKAIAQYSLQFAVQAVQALQDEAVECDDALARHVTRIDAFRLVACADASVVDSLVGALMTKTLDAGASKLRTDDMLKTGLRKALAEHLNRTWVHKSISVPAAVAELLAKQE